MNIFNLRNRDIPTGVDEYSPNEIRINLPDAAKVCKTNMIQALAILQQDMKVIEEHGLDMSVATQVVIDDHAWPLAFWLCIYLRQFGVVPTVVTQTQILMFSLQEPS